MEWTGSARSRVLRTVRAGVDHPGRGPFRRPSNERERSCPGSYRPSLTIFATAAAASSGGSAVSATPETTFVASWSTFRGFAQT